VREYLHEHTNPPVFITSALIVVTMVAFAFAAPDTLSSWGQASLSFITTNFGWLMILAVTGFLIFAVYLMVSRFGKIRLGPDDAQPEYSTLAWFAMLFTAGMGIGLVFYGVSEPVSHFQSTPLSEPGTQAAAADAMNFTFFHWLLHPWAVYIVLGLALGYGTFRHDLPMRPASIFYPLIGDRVHGWFGHLVDIIAVFGTIFGLATSLGLGATQISAGLNAEFGIPDNVTVQLALIAGITSIAVVSLMLGIDKGIRRLSEINLWLAVALMVFVFIAGPTLFILLSIPQNIGDYLQNLPVTSLQLFPYNPDGREWQATWTLFYWTWWIAWSPFVGMFIARISYGRTIRQFIAGVLFAPVGASAVWFTVFGASSLQRLLTEGDAALAGASNETALFVMLDGLAAPDWLASVASVLAIVVVTLFFATSSDSGSLVVDILTNGGDPNPIWQQRLFWALVEGAVAASLLFVGAQSGANALSALQSAAVSIGLPLTLVLIGMCWSLMVYLRSEDPRRLEINLRDVEEHALRDGARTHALLAREGDGTHT
jgi:choline/glycine/proline betaine transport protein